jgi:hypothetical protein
LALAPHRDDMILAVDTDTFWDIIATARAQSGPGQPFHQALTDCLAAGTEQDILQYQDRFDDLHAALYRWDVEPAAGARSGAATCVRRLAAGHLC